MLTILYHIQALPQYTVLDRYSIAIYEKKKKRKRKGEGRKGGDRERREVKGGSK